MSQDKTASRKEKKERRDAERQKKGKKRKRGESGEDEEQLVNEFERDFIPLDDGTVDMQEARKAGYLGSGGDNAQQDDAVAEAPQAPAKPKKRKKVKHNTNEHTEGDKQSLISGQEKKPRFILFIGNLPYTTTDASLYSHFKKLSPFTLRHRTDPKTKKSKGFAFLEFENFDRMKTCLKLYHHSMFDPAKANPDVEVEAHDEKDARKRKDKGGRRINVELTAGGGGKTEGRKEKIKAKNERLDGQRKRRMEEELKEKGKEKAKKAARGGVDADAPAVKAEAGSAEDHTSRMHPSRLARMKK